MRWRALLPALVAAALLGGGLAGVAAALRHDHPSAALVPELVNDHLRVLVAAAPAEQESADPRALEAWLAPRLGFAPAVPAPPGAVRLRGAALGYVLDRKAAVVLYQLRLHQLSLFAFRAEGLAWPAGAAGGEPPALRPVPERGFHAVLWRAGALGYALVSDSSPEELAQVAGRLAAATGGGP